MPPPISCSKPIPAITSLSAVCSAIAASPRPGTSTSASRRSRPRASSARWSPTWRRVRHQPSSPERRAMPEKVRAVPPCDWPTAEREIWKQACVAAQRLRPGGAAARMKSSTRTSLVRAYGYLLEFCHRNGLLDQDAEAGAHVTPEIIDAFVHHLHGRVGSVTRASYIGKIRRIAQILAPGRDLVWLGELEADLRYAARPRPKYHRIVSSERLLALGLQLIKRGETSKYLT